MARAFLVVMDSVGIGGAPDAAQFHNGDLPDLGANTLAHIVQACAAGQAEDGRSGPLNIRHLDRLGLGRAMRLASSIPFPGLNAAPEGRWGCASETSRGKDTPSGHWELAGVPVPWDWHFFPDTQPAFPADLSAHVAKLAGVEGILAETRLWHGSHRRVWRRTYPDGMADLLYLGGFCFADRSPRRAFRAGAVIGPVLRSGAALA